MRTDLADYWEFYDDFFGAGTFVTSAGLDPWVVTDTSSSGTPTYTRLDHGETAGVFQPGVAQLLLANTSEIENVCLSFGDKLCFDIDKVDGFECRLQLVPGTGSTKDSTTTVAWGLTGDRNDAIDSIANAAIFRLAAATASNVIVVESDDGTNNNDDVATGSSLAAGATNTVAGWHRFVITFNEGSAGRKKDVRFYLTDSSNTLKRVASGTTFDMSNYSAGLQPFFQIQKTADTNTDALQIDYVRVWGIR